MSKLVSKVEMGQPRPNVEMGWTRPKDTTPYSDPMVRIGQAEP